MRAFNETNPRSPADFVGVLARSAKWPGDDMSLFRAVPYGKTIFAPMDFIRALENLGVRPLPKRLRLRQIKKRDLPCLCLLEDGKPTLITEITQDHLQAIQAYNGEASELKRDGRKASILSAEPDPEYEDRTYPVSLWDTIRDLQATLTPLFAMSLLINLLALTGPLLVMTVYDTVIPSNTPALVWNFAAIVAALLIADFMLRWMRAGVLAKIGTAAERRLSLALFTKLLALPLAQVSRSTTHSQMSRIKQFESVRDVFAGNLLVSLLDFPFVLIFLAVVFVIVPPVGLLLCAMIVVFAIFSFGVLPRQRMLAAKAGEASNAHAALQFEIAEHAGTLAHFGLSDVYSERSQSLAYRAAESNRVAKSFAALSQNIGQTLVALGSLGSIAYAAYLAMAADISFGALIAVATLAGRVLGPVNTMAASLLRLKSLAASSQQITNVLAMDTELMRRNAWSRMKTLEGSLSASSAFVKFEAASEASLAGVSFEIAPNSLVVLAGKSGAGKSTLLKALTKLHVPASGSFAINGINIKQVMVDDLRNAISMNIQDDFMFDVSLRENLILGNPVVNDERLIEVYHALGAQKDLRRFYQGLNTDLSRVSRANLSANVVGTMALVRCLAKSSAVYMLDDPFSGMTQKRIADIWSHLKERAKTATVIVVSHKLEHMVEADQVLLLDKGRLVVDDTGANAGRRVYQMLQTGK